MLAAAFARAPLGLIVAGGLSWCLALGRSPRRSRYRSCAPCPLARDGPALNGALAGTGRLLAVFSLLLSAGVLLS